MSDPVTFTSAPAHQTISALTSRMQHVWPSDLHLCPLPTKPCQPLLQGCSMSDPMTFTSAPSPPPAKPCQSLLQGCSMSDPVTFTSAPTHQTVSALTSRMQHVGPSDLHLCPLPHPPNCISPYFKDAACLTQWPSPLPPSPCPPNHVSPYFKDAACLTQWPSPLPPSPQTMSALTSRMQHVWPRGLISASSSPPTPPTKPCQPIPHCCNMSDPVTMLLVFLQPCQLLSQGCNTSDPVTSLLSPPPRILLPSIVSALIIKVQHLTSSPPPPPTMSAFITRLQGIWPSDLTCLPPPSNYVSSYHKAATHLTHWLHLCSPPHPPPHLNHVSSYYKAATHLTHWLHLCSPPPPPQLCQLLSPGCNTSDPVTSPLFSAPPPPRPPPTISALITRLQHIWPSDLTSVH